MSTFDLFSDDMRKRSEQLSKLETVSDDIYTEIIPEEMSLTNLNKIYQQVFGVETMEIYLSRNVFDAKFILITDFSKNGFFWAQIEEEALSDEFKDLFYALNDESNNQKPLADLNSKWCIANFHGEWFRAYIQNVIDNDKLRVFFLDYGTFETVNHSDTRQLDGDQIWEIPPLAIPFVIKDITLPKLTKFKKLQYQVYKISSLKLIEKNCIFEVELEDKNGTPLLKLL